MWLVYGLFWNFLCVCALFWQQLPNTWKALEGNQNKKQERVAVVHLLIFKCVNPNKTNVDWVQVSYIDFVTLEIYVLFDESSCCYVFSFGQWGAGSPNFIQEVLTRSQRINKRSNTRSNISQRRYSCFLAEKEEDILDIVLIFSDIWLLIASTKSCMWHFYPSKLVFH